MNHKRRLQRARRRHPLWKLKAALRSKLPPALEDIPPNMRLRELVRLAWRRGASLHVQLLAAPTTFTEEAQCVYGIPPAQKLARSCNMHEDCAVADARTAARRPGMRAVHCNDEDCEDCFCC
jgi:hypothetical protein